MSKLEAALAKAEQDRKDAEELARMSEQECAKLAGEAKSARDTIPGHILRMIRKELEDGIDQEG